MKARGSIRRTYFRDDDANFQQIHTVEVALPLSDHQQERLLKQTIMNDIRNEMNRRGYSSCSLSAEMRHRINGLSCKLTLNNNPARTCTTIRKRLKVLIARLSVEPVMG